MQEKKILYLHVGMPKTGTSALQRFFKLNSSQLKEQGVIYPETGQWNDYSHHDIPFSLRKNSYKKALSKTEQVSFLETLNDEVKVFPRVLLSSECFSMLGKHSLFLKFLAQYDTKIVCYLRRQDLFLESHYKQVVADPALPKLNYKIDKHITQLHNTMTYFPFIGNWTKLGPLIIRPYERESFVDGNIFSDFGDAIDIRIDQSFVFPQEDINPSDSNAFVDFMRILKLQKILDNVLSMVSIDELRILVNENISSESTTTLLSHQNRIEILDKYSDNNRKIARLYLERDDLFKNLSTHDNERGAYQGLPEQEVFRILSKIIDKVSAEDSLQGKWEYSNGMSEDEILHLFSEVLNIENSDTNTKNNSYSLTRKFSAIFSLLKKD